MTLDLAVTEEQFYLESNSISRMKCPYMLVLDDVKMCVMT